MTDADIYHEIQLLKAWLRKTKGIPLNMLENFLKDKLGFLGSLLGGLLETGWAIITYFVVPVVVVYGVGPIEAVKRSDNPSSSRNENARRRSRMRSATETAPSRPVSGRIKANSSPPNRATTSVSRAQGPAAHRSRLSAHAAPHPGYG